VESRSEPEPEPAPAQPGEPGPAPAGGDAERTLLEFNSFYRDFVPTLLGFLLWQGMRLPDAAEVAQDTMTDLYRRWGKVDNPRTWARTVASRKYARWLASVEDKPVADVPEERSALLRREADPEELVARHEVLRLLALLPPRQWQVMAWTVDGYTPTEIAAELGISAEGVRASLLKARRKLAEHLEAAREVNER